LNRIVQIVLPTKVNWLEYYLTSQRKLGELTSQILFFSASWRTWRLGESTCRS